MIMQSVCFASPVILYAATHTDIISSASAYTNLNHAKSAFLSSALHVLTHNAVIRIWTADQSVEMWCLKRLS